LFMSWEEAREMRRGGMWIGSHAHSHQILAHLKPEEQKNELTTSKAILESHLGEAVHTVAYPVGTKGAFNNATLEAARSSGYKAGFSYIPGVNRPTQWLPFELRRISVDNNPDTVSVKLSTLLATELGIRAKELLDQQRRVLGRFRSRIR
jgi:peptidoglycan/xylan/chitin deacetylase (PgdA/CDA1 family)